MVRKSLHQLLILKYVGWYSSFLILQEFVVTPTWTSPPPRWKDLERPWRCRVWYQGLIWQVTIFTGYSRSRGKLKSGSAGRTVPSMPDPTEDVSSWLKTCPAALSTSRSGDYRLCCLLLRSNTQREKAAEKLHKNTETDPDERHKPKRVIMKLFNILQVVLEFWSFQFALVSIIQAPGQRVNLHQKFLLFFDTYRLLWFLNPKPVLRTMPHLEHDVKHETVDEIILFLRSEKAS